ncbi:globin-coupled sensor protein [Lysinibacillus sp. BW-2-10]|uniref:globin-coupled sensor protein n=1 Tax=Lysinibacillus sp. BW-2-10 TaxID=2590030 RepID=UPI0016435218|nr:globin-coupled sensor protein [Lysinibacillus sp. BW-2-10]
MRKPTSMNLNDIKVEIDTTQTKYTNQLQLLNLTEQDLKYLKVFKPYIQEKIHTVVDHFYNALYVEDSLIQIIDRNSSVDKLKVTLRNHVLDMFNGVINKEFFEKRKRIAQVHVRIGLKTQWYIGAFQNLLITIIEIVHQDVKDPNDQLYLIRAITKMCTFEQQLVLEEFENVVEAYKVQIQRQKEQISQSIIKSTESLAAVSEQTNVTFHLINDQSQEMTSYAMKTAELSISAEEKAKVGKIKIVNQHQNMLSIRNTIDDISSNISDLLRVTNDMETIIGIVTGIADQTNLLSLNASIEAARAGEYGKGFSVVAEEVRKLSDQTKQSVESVEHLLSKNKEHTINLVDLLERVNEEVQLGEKSMNETEEQFSQILNVVNESKVQSELMKKEIERLHGVISELASSFNEVTYSADQLALVAKDLE